MGQFSERPRGVLLHRLDTAALAERMRAIFALQVGADVSEFANYRINSNFGIVHDTEVDIWGDRQFILICSEGVSRKPDERGFIPVDFGTGMGGTYVEVAADVLWAARTEETVDLADHVRAFGDRLESNFWLHYKRLSAQAVNA